MKTKSLILAGLALAALVSCNKENTENPVFEGDEAYISVNIAYSDAATRGTADDPAFYYGTTDENAVSDAHFFFYNADGSFATYANKAISSWTTNGTDAATDDNIEKIGKSVVVLSGLKSTNYPVYMSVILNPNGTMINDLKNKSITEAQAYIISKIATEGTGVTGSSTDWTNFVMTSSSYDNGISTSGYFCEKLEPKNFQETSAAAELDANAVTAYVERLAAKVKVGLGSAVSATGKIGSFEVNGVATDLFINITGWGLDATTKDTYTFKNIIDTWDFTGAKGFAWNDATNHRSYWAKSTVYGVADGATIGTATAYYPENYADVKKTGKTPTLNFISWDDLKVTVDKAAYCRENTNTKAVLEAVNFSGAATSVLIKAQVTDGTNPVQLVNYGKKLYTFDEYKNKVLTDYNANHSGKQLYISDGATTPTYTAVTKDNLEEVNICDGYITLKLKDLSGTESYCYYDGVSTYTATSAAAATVEINGGSTASTPETKAEYYKDGMMYYNVPIEHLNNAGTKYGKTGFKTNIAEADYGVVRNHYYNIEITSIKNLGKAVYDPSEPIVPSDDDLKDYYVGAKINILSWKVVKQSVEL